MLPRFIQCVVLGAAAFCGHAYALEPKQCLPLGEMNAALKADGQRTLIIGNREALNNAADRASGVKITRYANVITANADGSLGYQLEGDLPRDQPSMSMCVRAKLTNVRLFDARTPGTQRAALLGGKFDDVVRDREKVGTRPAVIADTVHADGSRQQQPGLKMILFYNPQDRSASIAAQMADGSAQGLMLMGDTEYTPEALRRLNRPPSGG